MTKVIDWYLMVHFGRSEGQVQGIIRGRTIFFLQSVTVKMFWLIGLVVQALDSEIQ